jgi:tRNA G18 (ribose-2'-O)-methylase SpoU
MKKEVYLVLDNIRSRENVGSIFRTADSAGVTHIYLCGITPTPPHHKISKASLGAENYVSWSYIRNTWRIVTLLKDKGVNVVGLELGKDSTNIFKFKPKFPLALVLGNEVKGLSSAILNKCDKKIAIPMYGKKESLNVSVATGVALYQLVR